MSSQTLRRRLHHADVDGRINERMETIRSDSLNEPLLGDYDIRDSYSESFGDKSQQDLFDEKRKESLHWTFHFTELIAQWAQLLANCLIGSGSFIGRLITLPFIIQNGQDDRSASVILSPLKEERLKILKQRLEVAYDGSRVDHQDALKQLWNLSYPDREVPPLKSQLWKEMGWQGLDPSTDFRGGGFISLENLIFFAQNYPEPFQRLLRKQEGKRSEWEYPFAVAGINISFMLTQMLDLHKGMPQTSAGTHFLKLLSQDEMAFDKLFCVAFRLMDAQWLAKHASYMEFNDVMKSTKTQLEKELALEDTYRVQDMPAYSLLS